MKLTDTQISVSLGRVYCGTDGRPQSLTQDRRKAASSQALLL